MNKLFTKIAGLTVGLAMAIGVGVAVGSNGNDAKAVEATEGDVNISIAKSDVGSYASGDKTVKKTVSTTNDLSVVFKGTKTKKDSTSSDYTYIMFNSGAGFAYSSTCPSGYYPSSVTVTFSSSTGETGKAGIKYGTSSITSRDSTVTGSVSKSGTCSLTNTDKTKLYWNFSTTSANVQVSTIAIVYSLVSTAGPSLSDITTTKTALAVGDTTGAGLSVTPSDQGSNTVSWSATPSTGVTFTATSGNSTTVKFPSGDNALAAGTEVTIRATLTNTVYKEIKLCAIGNAGTSANPYKAIEAKYLALDGDTNSHYVAGYIAAINGQNNQNVWLSDNSTATTGDFELFGGYTNNAGVDLALHYFVKAHGTFAKYGTTAEATSSVIDTVDYVLLDKSAIEVNNTQTTTLSVSKAGGNVVWSTTAGTGSVSLSNQSNTGVTITGTSVGTATVTATVGTYSANCTVTVLEYASDWAFKSITLTTGTGFVSSYYKGADFDKTGITVTYVEHSDSLKKDRSFDRTEIATYNFDDYKNTVGEFNLTATYSGHTTTDVVTITILKEPGVIKFGSADGSIKVDAQSITDKTDNLGNSITITNAKEDGEAPYYSQNASYSQIGSGNDALDSLVITITLSSRSSIESFSIKFGGSANGTDGSFAVYADNAANQVLASQYSGTSTVTYSTDDKYDIVNGNTIVVSFDNDGAGIKLYEIQYELGDPVTELGTLSSIAISNSSAHETTFRINTAFSAVGLVITATDTESFSKDFTSGFTCSGYNMATTGKQTVTVSFTWKNVEKTTTYSITVIDPPTYSLIESQSALYEGMKVIIADTSSMTAVGSWNSSSTRYDTANITASTTVDGAYEMTNATEFTVRIYGSNLIALQYGALYLGGTTSGGKASQQASINEDATWALNSTGLIWKGTGSIYLQKNSSSAIYGCYSGTQTNVKLYVSSATPKTDAMGAATFAQKYLHMRDYDPGLHVGVDGENLCKNENAKHYYSTAKTAYGNLTAEEKTEFAKLSTAVARLQAWAIANSETFDPSAKTFSNSSGAIVKALNSDSGVAMIIIVASLVSLTAIGGYFLFKKKKQY